MGDLLLLAITCVCRLHWSARRGSWSRVVRWGVDFNPICHTGFWRYFLHFCGVDEAAKLASEPPPT
eukprot:scaffold80965_cov35-Phaeocystis_antarctica.AAC.1